MRTSFFNGKFIPAEEVKISPDDRGFLFADGIYEVVRWYEGFFYDMESHLARLKRSLNEVRISWPEADSFPSISRELIIRNNLQNRPSIVYLQVTRGAARRNHAFPSPPVDPTVYAFARGFHPDSETMGSGVGVTFHKDIRWSRCDIKSISLLPNILCFQKSFEKGDNECIFVRDGIITEGSHSNVFFVIDGILYTHPESEYVLSGITRKNVLRIGREAGITISETPVQETMLNIVDEAFITNTSSEVTPVITINKIPVGSGKPGPVTMLLREKFRMEILALKAEKP